MQQKISKFGATGVGMMIGSSEQPWRGEAPATESSPVIHDCVDTVGSVKTAVRIDESESRYKV